MARAIITPLGTFSSQADAARHYNVSSSTMQFRMSQHPDKYFFADEGPKTVYKIDEYDASIVKQFTVNDVLYNVDELYAMTTKPTNYKIIGGKVVALGKKARDDQKLEHFLKIATMSLDELQKLYPNKNRKALVSNRLFYRQKVEDHPEYIAWLKKNNSRI